MRLIDELKPSDQFMLWQHWEMIAKRHFGERKRPESPEGKIDDKTLLFSATCLWLSGGLWLVYCAVFWMPALKVFIEPYFTTGWFVSTVSALAFSVIKFDPLKRRTADQINRVRSYNQAMRRLGERFEIDLSTFCYHRYDGVVIDPVPPQRPTTPLAIPSRSERQGVQTNPHVVTSREIGLPGEIITPLSIRRKIERELLERYPRYYSPLPKELVRSDLARLKLVHTRRRVAND